MATCQTICTNALLESRVMRQAGQTPPPEQLSYAMERANRILGMWSTGDWFIYTTRIDLYTLSPSRLSYSIGPTGNFVAARPMRIINANLVLVNTPQLTRIPLALWDDDQWSAVQARVLYSGIPVGLYNDGSAPNSNLYLWPAPTSPNQLELFTPQQMPTFAALADEFVAPPGYEESLTLTLAEGLADSLPGGVLSPGLQARARFARSRQRLKPAPLLISNAPDSSINKGGGQINWRTRQFA